MKEVSRPALRYYGGKFRLFSWINSYFPAHTCYVEPYGGAASVLLQKPKSYSEVYNDKNGDVVNFFKVLREQEQELIRAIELTPYARDEYQLSQWAVTDPVERARRLYVNAWMKRQGYRHNDITAGWRVIKTDARGTRTPVDDWNNTGYLWDVASRLKEVAIENDAAITVIQRYDTLETLFYCDPPYVHSTRKTEWALSAYAYEMSEEDHEELGDVLNQIQGMAIVSGYPSELYNKIYAGWTAIIKEVAQNNQSESKTESLWLSPRTSEALAGGSMQFGMFAGVKS